MYIFQIFVTRLLRIIKQIFEFFYSQLSPYEHGKFITINLNIYDTSCVKKYQYYDTTGSRYENFMELLMQATFYLLFHHLTHSKNKPADNV